MTDNLDSKTPLSGKKILPDFLTRARIILDAIALGEMPLRIRKKLEQEWRYSKALFSQDIRKMVYDGWLLDENPAMNKYKFYKLTEAGRTVLSEWEQAEQKRMMKIENARHVCKIRNLKYLNSFLKKPEYQFKLNEGFRNSQAWYGRIEGVSIGIYIGKEVTMVITPQPIYAKDLITGHHRIHETILEFCNRMNKKWMLELSIPEPTTHRQYAIADDFAKDMMILSGGSPIKYTADNGAEISIDQSRKGKTHTEPRWETNDLSVAKKYGDMPDLVRLMIKSVIIIPIKTK